MKTFSLNATITSLPPFSHLRGVVVKKTTVVDPSVDNRSMPRDPKSDSNTASKSLVYFVIFHHRLLSDVCVFMDNSQCTTNVHALDVIYSLSVLIGCC